MWRVIFDLNPLTGDYEVQFRNIDDPGAGIDYDGFREVMRRVLSDLDRQTNTAYEKSGQEREVYLYGEDPLN